MKTEVIISSIVMGKREKTQAFGVGNDIIWLNILSNLPLDFRKVF